MAPEEFCAVERLDQGIFPPDSHLGERWEESSSPEGPSLFEPEED